MLTGKLAPGGHDLHELQLVAPGDAEQRERVAARVHGEQHVPVLSGRQRALRGERVDGGALRYAAFATGGVAAGELEHAVRSAIVDDDVIGAGLVGLDVERLMVRMPVPALGRGVRHPEGERDGHQDRGAENRRQEL